MKQVNWGIIGLGIMASKFADAFKFSEKAKLVAIASNDKNKVQYFKDKFDIENHFCFNNYEDLIKSDDIDIVYISLPNSLHFKWILKCIEYKKNILVEKPAVLNLFEIESIKKKINNTFFSEAFMYVYHPQTLKVIEMIKEGRIGKPLSMNTNFGIDIMSKKNLFGFKRKKKIKQDNRLFNKQLGGGVILDLGCYLISFSLLIGSLKIKNNLTKIKIKNIKKKFISSGVDINSSADLYFESGFVSKMRASFEENLGQITEIIGSEGNIIIPHTWTPEEAIVIVKSEKCQKVKIKSIDNIYTYEIEAVSNSIIKNKNQPDFPGLSINDTFQNTKILDDWLNEK